jgi:thiamine biosynthesis lipoprotein ApbE
MSATEVLHFEIATLLRRIGLDKVSWRRPRLTFLVSGMELDLGGVAKEYAADRAATLCRSRGVPHGLVDLGGDIAVVGPHPDGSPWRIGVRDPMGGEAAVAKLFVAGASRPAAIMNSISRSRVVVTTTSSIRRRDGRSPACRP